MEWWVGTGGSCTVLLDFALTPILWLDSCVFSRGEGEVIGLPDGLRK